MEDALGDRMKQYEMAEAGRMLLPMTPVLMRLDGKCFHTFTRGLNRPYDTSFQELMCRTAMFLLRETNAKCVYVQSDEISLAWYSPLYASQIWFNGRVQKMTTVAAGMAAAFFNSQRADLLPSKAELPPKRYPVFDARVWNVPTLTEAVNYFLWREQDATRNSISMAAQHYYSSKQLHGKSSKQMQDMLHSKGVNWNDYPDSFKRGVYGRKEAVTRAYEAEELDNLPAKHAARTNPDLTVDRTDYVRLALPKLSSIVNPVDVLFHGAQPTIFMPVKSF